MNTERALVNLLVRIVNQSGTGPLVAEVPVPLLREARKLLREYKDGEFSTPDLRLALHRIWEK